jgi:hypothetical protein
MFFSVKLPGMFQVLYALIFLFFFSGAFSQENIPIGTWKLHTPYVTARSIDIAFGKVYIASSIGSTVVDKADGSYSPLSKINGLSSYDVRRLKYNPESGVLLFAYSDGNIDLMKENSLNNVSDIKRKSIIGSKNINHIYFRHDSVFLSCDFGVSLLDLKKNEIKESYENLGKGGVLNRIYASTISNSDSIFIASDSGVMVAPVSPFVNLQDYNNWHLFKTQDSLPLKMKASTICTLNNKVYAGIDRKGIYVFNGTYWEKTLIPISDTTDIYSMNVSGGKILICAGDKPVASVISFDGSTFSTITHQFIAYPREAVYDAQGKLWIADEGYGVVSDQSGTFQSSYLTGAGRRLAIFKLYNYNNNIVALPGGYDASFQPLVFDEGYYEYDNYNWWTYDKYSNPSLSAANAFVDAVFNPANGSLYVSSYRLGLVERKSDGTHVVYNNTNPLPGGCYLSDVPPYIRVSGLTLDNQSNVWVTEFASSGMSSLFKIKPDGTCDTISPFPDPGNYALSITIDDYGNKWMSVRHSGIHVYNESGSKSRHLATGAGTGNLPNNDVTTIEKDKKGQIWIGTRAGLAVFYDPSQVFSTGADATIPIYQQFPLLFGEYVSCIEVDGGNRKWIGTQNGLWLFNEDGTQVIANYTTLNSPLLSNIIIDLEINKLSGELFIATDKGIISFRSDATESTEEFKDVKVFPNPVPENFNGLVGISGLATNAHVKITDIFGNLVYETTANGGTASWNVKNYNSVPAAAGVYLIYSTSSDGIEGFVSKIAVVR